MRFTLSAITVSVLSLTSAAFAAFPNPGKVTGSIGVHDPTLCRDSAGKYFMFATAPGISIRTSTDRIKWKDAGLVWPNGQATWTDQYTKVKNGNLWAPDCTYINGEFYLYYSASSFGSHDSAIFLAKSKTGLPGSWSNQGLITSSSAKNDYNAIDPNLIIDGSKWWLTFGSFWSGIKLVELQPGTGKLSSSTITSIAKRPSNGGAVEAPAIVKNGNFYYLFTSWDKCCSALSSTYNIRVGRATSITGPYVDKSGVALMSGGGTQILASHGSIVGPGGQSVFRDKDGWILDYHYYTSTGSLLGINKLDFSSGWPVVA
ncbi:arabinanase [Rhizoctonia solani]|nr:arabinanase [Rhizoctonia solani]